MQDFVHQQFGPLGEEAWGLKPKKLLLRPSDLWLIRLMDKVLLNYGNYGIFLIMGHAGFCPSTVGVRVPRARNYPKPIPRSIGALTNTYTIVGLLIIVIV